MNPEQWARVGQLDRRSVDLGGVSFVSPSTVGMGKVFKGVEMKVGFWAWVLADGRRFVHTTQYSEDQKINPLAF